MFLILLVVFIVLLAVIAPFQIRANNKREEARRAMAQADKQRNEEYGRKFWEDAKKRDAALDEYYAHLPYSKYPDLP